MDASHLDRVAQIATDNSQAALAQLGKSVAVSDIDRFLKDFASAGPFEHYRHVPPSAAAAVEKLGSQAEVETKRLFIRAALGRGAAQLVEAGALRRLPPRIAGHHAKQLERIGTAIAADGDWYDLANDRCLKDLGLVTLRLMAAAAQLLDTRCGIARSIVFRQGLAAVSSNLIEILRLGGFKPYIQIHTHLSYLDEFNEDGWNECYRCCADLYPSQPALLGMFGASWFYDPALAAISPRLNYLRDVPLAGGAKHFFVEAGGESIDNATSTSPSRKKLYEEGQYMPKSYLIAWGRKQQMDWASRNPSSR